MVGSFALLSVSVCGWWESEKYLSFEGKPDEESKITKDSYLHASTILRLPPSERGPAYALVESFTADAIANKWTEAEISSKRTSQLVPRIVQIVFGQVDISSIVKSQVRAIFVFLLVF